MMTSMISANDTDLVSASLSGNRDAFGQIVSRYQSLVCSLAYSATGSLSQSEDLAQETFLTAWRQLGDLREREKLRAWLCGIARNLLNNSLRKDGREPSHRAESLEEISESHSPEPLPIEQTISNEEAAILWRSLEKIPEIYREPLVLFYREHQSVETVAQNLELSEDAVKQRLSRGRKLLHEQVLAFVEGALEKTSPGKTFTLGVIAALPLAATSAKAATVGAALAKGGAAAKGVATIGTLGGLFAMMGGAYISLRARADDTKSPRERQFMLQMIGVRIVVALIVFGAFFGISKFYFSQQPFFSDILKAAFLFIFTVMSTFFFDYTSRRQRQIQIEEGTWVEAEWEKPRRETEPGSSPAGENSKSKIYLKMARFMAFALACFVVFAFQTLRSHESGQILLLLFFVLVLFLSFHGWQHRPRFQSPRFSWQIAIPLIMGTVTLLCYNINQFSAPAGLSDSKSSSPTIVIVFNAVVVFAYAAFIGIIVRKRKAAFPVNVAKIN